MLSPQQIVDKDFLEHRHMLIEIAAYLDRFDAAVERVGDPVERPHGLYLIDQALKKLREPASKNGRAFDLLELFAS
ncbi:MAG TPA: hypothetical protein PKD64_01635 [Pirellulaceae bacterium]|nr:hypothetical protein [Pirellulaceae bacterium]HMO90871.1 hypothetical protein [Pirellulaceae bacterium]HMP68653.1 hypothetical protein [Pirellulaceae bacterium]